jgi:branched-chain amino acid transport system ATP-binding protein
MADRTAHAAQERTILSVENLSKSFGSLVAVNDVSFTIRRGEVLGLIGPNGAGKTTLFNSVTGMYRPDRGRVRFLEHDITGVEPYRICKLGMSRTFQVTRAFPTMTVAEAVRVGAYNRHEEKEVEEQVRRMLAFFHLEKVAGHKCEDLGLALLRRVEIARSVATGPQLLLLDESAAGLNASELGELMDMLRRLRNEQGVTLCVVEHVMKMVMGICDRIVVLDYGVLIAEGNPEQISSNDRVIEAYLGKRALK